MKHAVYMHQQQLLLMAYTYSQPCELHHNCSKQCTLLHAAKQALLLSHDLTL
jgi:hypothetical protein